MISHFCPAERTMLDFEGECNWCGKKEEKPMNKMQKLNRKMLKAYAHHKIKKAKRLEWKIIKTILKGKFYD